MKPVEPGDRPCFPIGQERSVTVYELIAGDTIEEQIQNIKQDKAQLLEEF